jgi:hypothetical protein
MDAYPTTRAAFASGVANDIHLFKILAAVQQR